ncbi:hypothetical protein JCGZ_09702 [Jatropha curcas]|uniref:AAA-type ATPase N-terminal domain-containing protein n=1 Tax=Jatropha curcas TaxID=180498 RepID=A0A067LDY0_JATCU|nr:hypothetical protein JCGZ_09702 [Jatropha curcas]
MGIAEGFTQLGSAIAGLMFAWAMFQQYFPCQLRSYIDTYSQKIISIFYPYIHIIFDEYTGEDLQRSEVYAAIQNYLSTNSSMRAKRLKADVVKDGKSVLLTMDHHEEVTDDFQGIKVWWTSIKKDPQTKSFSFYPELDERRFFKLTVHRRYRDIIIKSYIDHVIKEGKATAVKNRQRKLYTNNPSKDWHGWRGTKWSHVVFEHPATFNSLAMATKLKELIKNDLIKFTERKRKKNIAQIIELTKRVVWSFY